MTLQETMQALEAFGSAQSKKILERHGAREPFFGVKIGDLKKLVKRIKTNHRLALELYATGNSDAMYLAGLVADPKAVTSEQLDDWAAKAYWYMLSEYTVAALAADSLHGWQMAARWIQSSDEMVAAAGWATYSYLVAITPDEEIKTELVQQLLQQIESSVHQQANRVRYEMNAFVIAVGSYMQSQFADAMQVASIIGKVDVYMGQTACTVPLATDYLTKMADEGRIGKKRKSAIS